MPDKEYICPLCGRETDKEHYEDAKEKVPGLVEWLHERGYKSIVEYQEAQE